MVSTEGLVPITREVLASYYDKYPFPPLSADISRLSNQIQAVIDDQIKDSPPTSEEVFLTQESEQESPYKIDQHMWKNREHMEEIVHLLDVSNWTRVLQQQSVVEGVDCAAAVVSLQGKFKSTLKTLENLQAKNSEFVFNIVMTYMPQDFRGFIIRQQRDRSERIRRAEVDALIRSGGSIHDRYALLWKQQMERRRQLAQLGSATGVYKTIVKYLVGVPQVLLDFIKQINDVQGPMEEQRDRYGPPLYNLTTMVHNIRLYISLLWGFLEAEKLQKQQISLLEEAADVYTSEFERYIKFNWEVFSNSPFFITAKDTDALDARNKDDWKEISVQPGLTHEVCLKVESINSDITWDFSLVQGKMKMDIGFSIECIDSSGKKTLILPYRQYESDRGNFCTRVSGNYKLIWDNSCSTASKKVMRYKVDVRPSSC